MAPSRKIALILAAGPRIGLSLATAFHSARYTVIVGCRSPLTNPATPRFRELGIHVLMVDVSSASSIMIAFRKIRWDEELGVLGWPAVVVYNAGALTMAEVGGEEETGGGTGIFGMEVWKFEGDLAVNLVGGYVALHETVKGWRELEKQEREEKAEVLPKVFIATGNVVPFQPVPVAMTLGSGRAALAHLVQCGSMSEEYQRKGWKFHFVSQVTEEGGPVPYDKVDGEAHGREYLRIVEKGQREWDVRFVA